MGSHGGLDDLKRLAQGGDLEHVEAGAEQQIGELDGLLLQLLRLAHGGGHSGGLNHVRVCLRLRERGPDQGKRVLRR